MNKINLYFWTFGLMLTLFFAIESLGYTSATRSPLVNDDYSCIPCGQSCDNDVYSTAGKCSNCQMTLVKKSTISFKSIEPSTICNYISKNPKVILLDVRTKDEFEGKVVPNLGRLKNAINLPIQELEEKIASLAAYKDREIIVYCSLSRRSPMASYILTQNGFKNITNMTGGMTAMKDNSCKVQ